ncbi:MAG: bifunctional serine/threonine-protein kinase/formylglycine-generating enzyme family protein [Planctomycetales bacterium]|nr:bifunctional serine/threonine-protein kinase/formylglycine-generating enzyme family protein [Planctomycetales bacterium]
MNGDDEVDRLEGLLERALAGEDVSAPLAALPPEVRARLEPALAAGRALGVADTQWLPARRLRPADARLPAEQLGPYRLVRELGRGGQATVYLAEEPRLRRQVALKVLHRDQGLAAAARFRREAQAVARLGAHPGVVAVHDIGEADGWVYLAMDLVQGRTLAAVIETGELSHTQAADWVAQAARALYFAHAHGILHRDVKPGNLLVDADGRIRVSDFGLAATQAADPRSTRLTRTGYMVGTPFYMAPEQARGETTDARADVYALGVTLYECLTGVVPFEGETAYDVLDRTLREEPRPPRSRNPQIPRDLDTIALKCLEKDPDRRYPTAEALAADLERWRAGEPIQARRVGPLGRLAKRVRRNPAPWAVGAVLGAALLVTAGVHWGSRVAQGIERRTEVRLWLEGARAVLAEAPDRALALLDHVAKADPGHPGLPEARAAALARRGTLALDRLLADARPLLRTGAEQARAHAAALAEVRRLDADRVARRLSGEEMTDPDGQRRRVEARRYLDASYGAAQAAFDAAGLALATHGDAPERREAAEACAALAWARLEHAEAEGRRADAARFEADLRRYDAALATGAASPYADRLRGDGRLTLDTVPSGAKVECRRFRPGDDGRWEAAPYDPAARAFRTEPVSIGTTPLAGAVLPMGSYLLILRAPGKRDVRYPVLVERAEDDALAEPVPLLTDAEIGEGFVYVPPGETIFGAQDATFSPEPRRRRWIPAFCLAEREVTLGEYLEFLDDRLRAARLSAEEVQAMAPKLREASDRMARVLGDRVVLSANANPEWPVCGVSWNDARAYCAWRTEREGGRVELPSMDEWCRAARGADDRTFLWGDRFDWEWTLGGRSRIRQETEGWLPVLSVPADVSVFGVRDMAGSLSEWCLDAAPEYPGTYVHLGGNLVSLSPTEFLLGSLGISPPTHGSAALGFRVRAEPRRR